MTVPEALEPWIQKKAEDLLALLARHAVPLKQYQRFKFTEAARHLMAPPRFPPETYQKVQQHGVHGAIFRLEEDQYEVWEDWGELVALIGSLIAGSMRQQGRAGSRPGRPLLQGFVGALAPNQTGTSSAQVAHHSIARMASWRACPGAEPEGQRFYIQARVLLHGHVFPQTFAQVCTAATRLSGAWLASSLHQVPRRCHGARWHPGSPSRGGDHQGRTTDQHSTRSFYRLVARMVHGSGRALTRGAGSTEGAPQPRWLCIVDRLVGALGTNALLGPRHECPTRPPPALEMSGTPTGLAAPLVPWRSRGALAPSSGFSIMGQVRSTEPWLRTSNARAQPTCTAFARTVVSYRPQP